MRAKRLVYEEALKKWGTVSQLIMLFEELSELQKAVCKITRGNIKLVDYKIKSVGITNIIEEIADVEIMIGQLLVMLKVPEYRVADIKAKKLERLDDLLLGRD